MQSKKTLKKSLLCHSRFIVNQPPEELQPQRIFFHLQSAYWFYTDFICPPENDKMNQIQFYQWITSSLPFLSNIKQNIQLYLKKYKEYSKTIPLYGAIILNENLEQILLVMNYSLTMYSFPKGKVNQNENETDCAIREVWEEIGFDITGLINKKIQIQQHNIEFVCEETGQIQKMFVIQGVSLKEQFKTNTRNEIGKIEWTKISVIFENKEKYSSLFPFMYGIRKYITHAKSSPLPFKKEECIVPKSQQQQQFDLAFMSQQSSQVDVSSPLQPLQAVIGGSSGSLSSNQQTTYIQTLQAPDSIQENNYQTLQQKMKMQVNQAVNRLEQLINNNNNLEKHEKHNVNFKPLILI